MDDFKKNAGDIMTVYDLNVKYVRWKNDSRRKLCNIARRISRRRLKRLTTQMMDY